MISSILETNKWRVFNANYQYSEILRILEENNIGISYEVILEIYDWMDFNDLLGKLEAYEELCRWEVQ
ncbi:hypothetical protein [Oceanotoga phage vB_OteS-UFV02]